MLYGQPEWEHASSVCAALALPPWDAPTEHCLVRASLVAVRQDGTASAAAAAAPSGSGGAAAGADATADAPSLRALVMRRYTQSLALAPQLDLDAVCAGVARLQCALEFMHSRTLVHMDVKSDNVVLDIDGRWLLCDIGSCTVRGQPVTSYTERFHPEKLLLLQARDEYDWDMLLVLLLVEAEKEGWKALLSEATGRVSMPGLLAALGRLRQRGAHVPQAAGTAAADEADAHAQRAGAQRLWELAASLAGKGSLGLAQ